MNKPLSFFGRLLSPDPLLFWAYVLPMLYWAYLTLTANFVLVFDSEDYYTLGQMLHQGQWAHYFASGPNREPLYPLVIAAAMSIGGWLKVSYTYPLKVLCFGFLLATMILIHQALRHINARRWAQSIAVLYTGFSPVLINYALCLYSEIVTFPWLVAAVLAGIPYLGSLRRAGGSLRPAAVLSVCLLGFTFGKGAGEALAPLFFLWLFVHAWRTSGCGLPAFLRQAKIKILVTLLVFYVPVLGFKGLNYAANGHFNFTNRGITVLYGSWMTRSQYPIRWDNVLAHVTSAPLTYHGCTPFFSVQTCNDALLPTADDMYLDRLNTLRSRHLTGPQANHVIGRDFLQTVIDHPFSQVLYFPMEGLKMFFWETSQGPFVIYPPWIEDFRNRGGVVVVMSLGVGCLCLAGYVLALRRLNVELVRVCFVLTTLLVFIYSFVNIMHRFTVDAAPLMILLTAGALGPRPRSRR